jgi:hypothetical protein
LISSYKAGETVRGTGAEEEAEEEDPSSVALKYSHNAMKNSTKLTGINEKEKANTSGNDRV